MHADKLSSLEELLAANKVGSKINQRVIKTIWKVALLEKYLRYLVLVKIRSNPSLNIKEAFNFFYNMLDSEKHFSMTDCVEMSRNLSGIVHYKW